MGSGGKLWDSNLWDYTLITIVFIKAVKGKKKRLPKKDTDASTPSLISVASIFIIGGSSENNFIL